MILFFKKEIRWTGKKNPKKKKISVRRQWMESMDEIYGTERGSICAGY